MRFDDHAASGVISDRLAEEPGLRASRALLTRGVWSATGDVHGREAATQGWRFPLKMTFEAGDLLISNGPGQCPVVTFGDTDKPCPAGR
jgi:hypothetical protein